MASRSGTEFALIFMPWYERLFSFSEVCSSLGLLGNHFYGTVGCAHTWRKAPHQCDGGGNSGQDLLFFDFQSAEATDEDQISIAWCTSTTHRCRCPFFVAGKRCWIYWGAEGEMKGTRRCTGWYIATGDNCRNTRLADLLLISRKKAAASVNEVAH